jgi:hypothetical protein
MDEIDYQVGPGIIMRTKRDQHGVHYSVRVHDRQRWYAYVRFGNSPRNRAGGTAFVEASQQQEKIARAALDEDDR